jgi:hypothetical protein
VVLNGIMTCTVKWRFSNLPIVLRRIDITTAAAFPAHIQMGIPQWFGLLV